ncbi:MAG: NUDIX hydrolase [Flavobacteriaceae bacterium]
MYKVFFNQKPLILTTKFIEQTESSPLFFLKFTHKTSITSALKSKKVDCLYLYHPKEEKLWQLFFDMFKLIEAAGGIVRHSQTGKYLFIYRNNKWDIPKGRIEKNESVQEAAIREVEEETGVKNVRILKALPNTFHIFNRNGKYRLKKTYWYAMTTDDLSPLVPQANEGIQKAEWKANEEIQNLFKNAYANIQMLWENIPS